MDHGDGFPPWDGTSSYTNLLMTAQYGYPMYEATGSHTNVDPMFAIHGGTTSQEEEDEIDDIHVDAFGEDHEDDMCQSEEEDTEAIEKSIRDEAINPNWNIVEEPDPVHLNSWQNWNATNEGQLQDGGEFERGQLFSSLDELKMQLTEYSARKNRPFRTKRICHNWYVVLCARKDICGCTWRLSATRVDPTIGLWRIVKYAPHIPNCVGEVMEMGNRNVSANFIRSRIIELIRKDQTLKPSVIREVINGQYGVYVSYMKAWKAKHKAIAEIFGDWEQSYNDLPRYMAALVRTNPGTVVEWCNINTQDPMTKVFGRVFWAFAPSIVGFEHCRPLITIDGTHLYGKYKHVMLIAMGVDAEDQIFPLAFAIVEGENGSSWPWFMDCIGRRVTQRLGLCVISDRHAGIMKAMEELDRWRKPNAHHRICIRHLKSNINAKHKCAKLKKLVGWTAYQIELRNFTRGVDAIKKLNEEVYDYLYKSEPEKWSLHYDGGRRYGVMTTNLSECFNGVLKGARCLPVTAIVQQTFYRMNNYFVKRRGCGTARAAQSFPISECVETKIGTAMKEAMRCHVIPYDLQRGIHEVIVTPTEMQATRSSRSYTVTLQERTCSCERWKILKVPCCHVLAVCRVQNISYHPFVDSYFTTDSFLRSYQMTFRPVGEPLDWPEISGPKVVADLTKKRESGRPRNRRLRNEMDEGEPGIVRCGICKREGHNRRTCPGRAGTSGS